jgi:hypothetical protein
MDLKMMQKKHKNEVNRFNQIVSFLANYIEGHGDKNEPTDDSVDTIFIRNEYLSFGIKNMIKETREENHGKLFIIDEYYFQNILALMDVLYRISALEHTSILIVSSRVVTPRGHLSNFFVHKNDNISEWLKMIKIDNASQANILLSYYHTMHHGTNLTNKELQVLRAMQKVPKTSFVGRLVSIDNKQVSHYRKKIKDKFGIERETLFHQHIRWLCY